MVKVSSQGKQHDQGKQHTKKDQHGQGEQRAQDEQHDQGKQDAHSQEEQHDQGEQHAREEQHGQGQQHEIFLYLLIFCYLTWKRLRSHPRGTCEVPFALYGFREYFNHQKLTISTSPVFKVLIVQA